MKKYMLAAVLSVLLLTAACSKEETKTADAKTSSVLSDSETEDSDHADGKSEIEKEADEASEKVSENHIIGNYCHNTCRNVRISLSEIQA